MASRKLKVYSSFRSNDKKAVPEIRLIGQWIEALGFEIGTPVKVTVREQLLIIEPAYAEAPAGKPLTDPAHGDNRS